MLRCLADATVCPHYSRTWMEKGIDTEEGGQILANHQAQILCQGDPLEPTSDITPHDPWPTLRTFLSLTISTSGARCPVMPLAGLYSSHKAAPSKQGTRQCAAKHSANQSELKALEDCAIPLLPSRSFLTRCEPSRVPRLLCLARV
jgi:hypothetical protein